jgi:hypothetical protein
MSKRTRNLLILALVLFLCCFGGSLANPFASTDDSPENPIAKFIGKFAADSTTVPDKDIRAEPAACRVGPDKFQFAAACTLHITGGGTGMRNLVLTGTKKMKVTSPVPRKDFTVSGDVEVGNVAKVAIDERGGVVVLACLPPVSPACVVTRGDGG